jgi:hypothetical protein
MNRHHTPACIQVVDVNHLPNLPDERLSLSIHGRLGATAAAAVVVMVILVW